MKHSALVLLVLSCNICLSLQRSTIDDPDYVVGVVEFTPELPTVNWEKRTVLHFENYTRIIREAAEQDVDLLIFPEYTLNNVAFPIEIPDPVDAVNPCMDAEDFDNLLIDLSCLARDNEIYLCINLSEREQCDEESQEARNDTRACSSLGITRFNTNIVLDRNGTVVARYRKFNLFREGGINTTLTAELSTFATDFGVTFGNIICFDVLFFEPAMQLVQMGVKNFLFSAMWVSELPFLTSNQIYQSWAYRNNVNLFAAGTNFAPAVATGSGFFLGRAGNVHSVFSENPIRDFYAMRISKNLTNDIEDMPEPIKNSFRSLNFGRDFVDTFKTALIDLTADGIFEAELCHEEHCCSFLLDFDPVESNQTFRYRLVAFNGDRTYSGWGDKRLVICALMLCNDDTLDSCARMPDYELDQVTFNGIEISTTFNRFGVLMMPNSLDLKMDPLNVDKFSYDEIILSSSKRMSTIILLQPHSDLQAFALYGHDFRNDEEFDFETEASGVDGSGDEGSGFE